MNETELRRRLYVPNYDHWQRQCSRRYFSDRTLEVQTLEKGVILPARQIEGKDVYHNRGGVCDKDMKFVAGYNNMPPKQKNGAYCLDEAYPIEPKELEQSSDEVIYGGILVCHFGRFITECLSRMWYVVENPEDRRKVVFIMIKTSPLQELKVWVYQILDLLGLPEDRVVIIEKPTQFKSVTVPEQSARIKHDYTRKYLVPFDHIKNRVRPFSGIKKVFLTRSKDLKSAMTLINQDYFETFYRARGFQVIAPEKLSVIDQIALITGAEEIVTFQGTLGHWSLFSHAGANWTFLNRVDDIVSRQCLINEATGIDWCFVSVAMNFLYAEQGDGVCLIGSTDHWKRYAFERFNVRLNPNARLPIELVDDYIDQWCKYFSGPSHVKKRIDSLEEIHSRISILESKIKLKRPVLCYQLHVAQKGWLPTNVEGDIAGALDKKYGLQALRLYFSDPFGDVFYSVYHKDSGWNETVSNKTMAGTVGKNKSIHGLSIKLGGKGARLYNVLYRIHNTNGNWSAWQMNGVKVISNDSAIDGVQIELELRASERGV